MIVRILFRAKLTRLPILNQDDPRPRKAGSAERRLGARVGALPVRSRMAQNDLFGTVQHRVARGSARACSRPPVIEM